jgi:hypothetical protein
MRIRAMQQLLSIPASDPQAAEHWIDIRKYLNGALRDPNSKVSVRQSILKNFFYLKYIFLSIGTLLETSFSYFGLLALPCLS